MPRLWQVAGLLMWLFAQKGVCELPAHPPLAERCVEANLVVAAIPVAVSGRVAARDDVLYFLTFQVSRVLKNDGNQELLRHYVLDGNAMDGEYVTVALNEGRGGDPMRPGRQSGCRQIPRYETGKKYALFLEATPIPFVYARCKCDRWWKETPWSGEIDRTLTEITVNLDGPGKFIIPWTAVPHERALSVQEASVFGRAAGLYLGQRKVGERAWWPDGAKAFEECLADGARNGVYCSWDEKGEIREQADYRDGKIHGIRKVRESGTMKTTYFVAGQEVSRADYAKAASTDPTLRRLAEEGLDAATRPTGVRPGE